MSNSEQKRQLTFLTFLQLQVYHAVQRKNRFLNSQLNYLVAETVFNYFIYLNFLGYTIMKQQDYF